MLGGMLQLSCHFKAQVEKRAAGTDHEKPEVLYLLTRDFDMLMIAALGHRGTLLTTRIIEVHQARLTQTHNTPTGISNSSICDDSVTKRCCLHVHHLQHWSLLLHPHAACGQHPAKLAHQSTAMLVPLSPRGPARVLQ